MMEMHLGLQECYSSDLNILETFYFPPSFALAWKYLVFIYFVYYQVL